MFSRTAVADLTEAPGVLSLAALSQATDLQMPQLATIILR
jgi:hypothetical protein